jgi:Fic family protein
MIPLIDTPQQYLDIRAQLGRGESATGDLAESLTMEAAIEAARTCRDEMSDPALAELHLRHWHALATRGIDGFLPGHFKYTQNWSTRYPTLKRVDPALTSGTFRQFTTELYAALQPGLLRATVAYIGFLDLHPFADGNGRVGLTWLNRELEWAGLMPALFPRDLSMKGEAGRKLKLARDGSGDLSGLLDVVRSAQLYAVEFSAALPSRR